MNAKTEQLQEFHWLMDLLQTIDVGLVVIDKAYCIKVWNAFMENHSGMLPRDVRDRNLFEVFPDIPKAWFQHKIDTVFLLKNRAFTSWEQRQWVFPFRHNQPISGVAGMMYQNLTINPLVSSRGEVEHVSIVVYDVTDIALQKKELQQANAELKRLSRTDMLTQLLNRGAWESLLAVEFERYQRYRSPTSLVMFDIDHFKKVNDTYGHPTGDVVIQTVAEKLREVARRTDIPGRYGGEEFGVILPNTTAQAAKIFCERLRRLIEKTTITHEGQTLQVTISLGVCEAHESFEDYQAWLDCADKALYQSKENGRNQTTIYQAS